jgi:hypothetical protein
MTWGLFSNPPSYDAYMDPSLQEIVEDVCCYDSPHVYPFPDLTTRFGDVYEAIVYSFFGERLRVCKSVSQPFLEAERIGAIDEIERGFLHNASEEGDDPRTWKVNVRCLTTLLLPEYGRALIEADIFGELGSPEQKRDFRMLKEELRTCGYGYLKRARVHTRR